MNQSGRPNDWRRFYRAEYHSMFEEKNPVIIDLDGPDGQVHPCQLLDLFSLENREYAMLLKLSGPGSEVLLIMRVIRSGNRAELQKIEDEDEFQRVVAHIEMLIQRHASDPKEP
jgi:hypothetical protein